MRLLYIIWGLLIGFLQYRLQHLCLRCIHIARYKLFNWYFALRLQALIQNCVKCCPLKMYVSLIECFPVDYSLLWNHILEARWRLDSESALIIINRLSVLRTTR